MKRLRRPLSLLLAALLLLSLFPAAASDACGEELVEREIALREDVTLHAQTFWSSYYADLRQEYYVTYTPGGGTRPMVSFGDYVTQKTTLSSAAEAAEEEGLRVAAGFNADFFDSNGVPTGILVSDGVLLGSDGANYAVGFRADGSAVIGLPGLKLSGSVNGRGAYYIAAVNKARSAYGGICFYTHGFNAASTTGTTDPGVNVILEPAGDGEIREMLEALALEDKALQLGVTADQLTSRQRREALAALELPESFVTAPTIGDTAYYKVVEVTETASGAVKVGEGQAVLTVNAGGSQEELDYLRGMEPGDIFGLTVTAKDEAWNDVTEAVGGLYLLVEDGQAKTNLGTSNAPRTAIGVKAGGEVVIYTVDGRQSGYSIGSSLNVLAERMAELGCETAICFDGGGSTTALAALPDTGDPAVLGRPSEGAQRQVTNCLLLVSEEEETGRAGHVYLDLENPYVLAGSTVAVRTALVDTAYFPMDGAVELTASAGTTDGNTFTAPETGGTVRLTATAGRKSAQLSVQVVDTPDELRLYANGARITSLSIQPGAQADLSAQAWYSHLQLTSADTDFTWSVSEGLGTVGEDGVFTAAEDPGTGTLTVTKGGCSLSIPVTITTMPLKTLEDFEDGAGGYSGYGAELSAVTGGDTVRYGSGALAVSYTLDGSGAGVELGLRPGSGYTRLTFSVYGDGSGNLLSLYDNTGASTALVTLDFTGWREVSLRLPEGCDTVSALLITGDTPQGTIYLDQFVASYGEVIDHTAPVIEGAVESGKLTAAVTDDVDGALGAGSVRVLCDGEEVAASVSGGTVTADLTALLGDGKAHRVSLTAWDASGNRSRQGWDIPASGDATNPFVDSVYANGSPHWAASYLEYFYQQGVLTGYAVDGQYYARPDQEMSRAEFAVMLFRYLGLEAEDYADVEVPFADLEKIDAWALDAAKAMYALGIMKGNGSADGTITFDPHATITRAQAVTMLGRLQEKGYAADTLERFSDREDVPGWALPYVQTMCAQGILAGSGDGSLNPNGAMTRGQACKVLYMMR